MDLQRGLGLNSAPLIWDKSIEFTTLGCHQITLWNPCFKRKSNFLLIWIMNVDLDHEKFMIRIKYRNQIFWSGSKILFAIFDPDHDFFMI